MEPRSLGGQIMTSPEQDAERLVNICYQLVLLISVWSLVDKSKSHQHRCVSASSKGTQGLKDWRGTLEPRQAGTELVGS